MTHPSPTALALVADIGGTNTRVALADGKAPSSLQTAVWHQAQQLIAECYLRRLLMCKYQYMALSVTAM